MLEMKTLTINEDMYEVVDATARETLSQLQNSLISFPKDNNENINYGLDGQVIVSDGNGGIKWVTLDQFEDGNEVSY